MSDPSTRLLTAALAKISKPGAWTQGAFARLGSVPVPTCDPGATCWCSIGVCMAFDPHTTWGVCRPTLEAEARLRAWTLANHGCGVVGFNDHPDRTQADVVAMFEAVIAEGLSTEIEFHS